MGDKPAKKKADWDAIELEYRAGVATFEEMATKHGSTKGRISQVAKARGWVRDLSAKIKAKADAKLNKDALNAELNAKQTAREDDVVEANAELQAQVRRDQRTDITRARKLVVTLLTELEMQTGNIELLERLAELLYDDPDGEAKQSDAQSKRMEAFNKVISLSGRTGTMKGLAESLRVLVALEREAFGIDDRKTGATSAGDIGINF